MTGDQRGSSVVEFPSNLEITVSREFQAPVGLVFDVLWKPEHLRRTIAPFGETVTVCEVDLRVGGDYHYVFVTGDGVECSFRGTFLEVEPPTRSVQTWHFDGWPDADAVETFELRETGGRTTLTWRLAFTDQAGRDHMTRFDGIEANLDNVEAYLASLLDGRGTASG
jgi:uncharacterized protein YndB with AHSA1/START domain